MTAGHYTFVGDVSESDDNRSFLPGRHPTTQGADIYIAIEHEHGPDPDPCRGLWCGVLLRAIEDACEIGPRPRNEEDARRWLLGMSPGFVTICDAAGQDPDLVREGVQRIQAAGWVLRGSGA